MDIQFYGANCISIGNKQARVVIDENLESLGKKPVLKNTDIALFTGVHEKPAVTPHLTIEHPGEYEVSNVSIYGIAARAHMEETKKKEATMYKIMIDDIRYLITGHVYPELSERQLEEIGTVDVMFVPVGGNGYTTDPVGALKLIKKVEPKIIIPTHFADKELNFEVPQQELSDAITALSLEPKEAVEKLRLKTSDFVPGMQLIVLKRTS